MKRNDRDSIENLKPKTLDKVINDYYFFQIDVKNAQIFDEHTILILKTIFSVENPFNKTFNIQTLYQRL